VSTALYREGVDIGNALAKGFGANGRRVTIRNAIKSYDGTDDVLMDMIVPGDMDASWDNGLPTTSTIIEWKAPWSDDFKRHIVGDMAFVYGAGHPTEVTGEDRYEQEEWYGLLAATMIQLYSRSGTVDLTLSMPIDLMRANFHEQVTENIAGEWIIRQESKETTFNIPYEDIRVIPEGFGVFASQFLNGKGDITDRELAGARVIILDIGGYTFDVMTFEGLRWGSVNLSEAGLGIITIRDTFHDIAKQKLERRTRFKTPDLDEILMTSIYRRGGQGPGYEGDDVTDLVNLAIEPIRQKALEFWQNRLGQGEDYDVLIIGGGGSRVLGNRIKEAIQARTDFHDIRIVGGDSPHMQQAIGSLCFDQFKINWDKANAAQR